MKEIKTNKPQLILQNLLREKRRVKNISQSELAYRIGMPQSSVSKYEAGERKLDVIELMCVCQSLEISLSEFTQELEKRIKEINK